jgi:hypothetical protein
MQNEKRVGADHVGFVLVAPNHGTKNTPNEEINQAHYGQSEQPDDELKGSVDDFIHGCTSVL